MAGLALGAAVVPEARAFAQRADLEQMELVVNANQPVTMTINEMPVEVIVAPDAISVPTVNADAAARLGLEPSMIGYVYVIGATRLLFRTDTVRYHTHGGTFRRRTAFSQAQVIDGADVLAGPTTFPFARTVIQMRAPQAEDRPLTFAIAPDMGRSQSGPSLQVGDRTIFVAFNLTRAESLVSATGGKWIADATGGWLSGEAREIPVLYGVERPVRPLTLSAPLMLGELEIRNLAVRVSDMGDASGLTDEAPPEPDPNEIVVTGDSGREVPMQRLYIGLDTIGHCASITFDREAETVTLMCPPQPPV
ncbi:hypothetical protein [Aurantiacibacter luteus]|uniref:Uncharacterized protein n=1 Tax=Aurantiacibacter luteus TaxID=1581420 RepID=A0A0G9N0J8_9SPHN|nr:hypothetical protein [Aurantiacibacter luteus]KLE35063.1 hypothetical protein AAW00_00760 [Aurantiacibacter luteus]